MERKFPQTNYSFSSMGASCQHGLSMIELMVSMTLSLILLTGVATLYINTLGIQQNSNRIVDLNNNARTALTLISKDIASAGYANGAPIFDISTENYTVGSDCNNLASAKNLKVSLLAGRATANIFGCVSDAKIGDYTADDGSPSDWILLKGAVGSIIEPANLQADTNYIIADVVDGKLFRSTSAPGGYQNASIREYRFSLFYLTENNELALLQLVNNSLTRIILANNILNFRVRLGMSDSHDGNVANFVEVPVNANNWTVGQWQNIRSVELNLLLSNEANTGYTNNNSYTMGDITVKGDGINQHLSLASHSVFLYNQSFRQTQ